MKREKLFSEFPPISTEQWMDKITTDLKGAPFEKKLVWRTKEGFNVMPFYRREDIQDLKTKDVLPGEYPYVRGIKADNSWYTRQDVTVGEDVVAAAGKLPGLINRGAGSFGLTIKKDLVSKETIATLIRDIDPNEIELNFTTCRTKIVDLAKAVVEAYQEKGVDFDKAKGSIGFDPFKKQMVKGVATEEWIEIATRLIQAVAPLKHFTCLNVRGVDLNNAGAYIYQELGYALAAGADILDELSEKSDLTAKEIVHRMRFDLGIGSNYFMEIAKFRAIRWLWALIVNAHDDMSEEDGKILVNAETSRWNKTVYDAYVNLLRTQTETMSAAIAGVHSLVTLPFDIIFKEPDSFSYRIARNQQLLLKEESHFDKVVDPAGGSYYIEHLTDAIAHEGWKLFLDVQENGGFHALANEGKIQEAVNASNEARHKSVATRRENLLGTNIFPNFNEMANEKLTAKGDGRHTCSCEKDATVATLDFSRGGSDFEKLRLQTEAFAVRPKVFMLTIGNLAMRLARSQFSANFFGCAGYQILDNLGFDTVQAGVDAAIAAKADIIVLCSSDDEYAQYGPEAYDIIDGRVPLVIAGAPACMEDLQAKGIEHFVHVKVNVLEKLREFQKILGIEK